MAHGPLPSQSLTLMHVASCKWRDAQRTMRNRQFIDYTLGPLKRNVRGRPFDSERGGGGLSNVVWTDNLFSAWARPENLCPCGMGKIYFCVNMVYPHSTALIKAITRNSNVIESSSIRWNY